MRYRHVPTLNAEYFDAIERNRKDQAEWSAVHAPFMANWVEMHETVSDAYDAAVRYIYNPKTADDDPMIEKLSCILSALRSNR